MRPVIAVLLAATPLGPQPRSAVAQAAAPISYEISFENRAHHEAVITVRISDLPERPLDLAMSRSSPGRYALHEFAKNVYDVVVRGADGRPVALTRPQPHRWEVRDHGGEVTVTYTLYGDRADGTYTAIDRTHAHLNMPATFMWPRGLGDRPIELTVRVPQGSGWRVATQLAPTSDPYRFTAPDLYYFLDSPTEASAFRLREWQSGGQTIRVALHHTGTDAEAERYVEAAARIVETTRDIYGDLPPFDFGTYTFLACYLPWAVGDGMEHRNSTVLTSRARLATSLTSLLGTVAHEFFHAWNVERIRPASLEPFDFERQNMSGELWFGEGFTSYYDVLVLWRSGLISDEAFASRMGRIVNAVINARGRAYRSPVEMSMLAPFVDAATSVDPTNLRNTFFSYYTWGSGIALALDATLRTRFDDVTLDDLMRDMWKTHGVPEYPYDVAGIQAALTRITDDAAFAAEFFDRYVRGREAPDYDALLEPFGIDVVRVAPDGGSLGPLPIRFEDGGATVVATPAEGTPFYEAGVDRGDRILSIDGDEIADRADLNELLTRLRPGSPVEVRYESRGEALTETVTVGSDPELTARWLPVSDATGEAEALRAAWSSGPAS